MITLPIWVFVLLIILAVPGFFVFLGLLFWVGIFIRSFFYSLSYKEEAEIASHCPDYIEAPGESEGN